MAGIHPAVVSHLSSAHLQSKTEDVSMTKLAVAMLLAVGLVMVGCGSSTSKGGSVNGTWTAMLTGNSQNPVFSFSTALIDNGDGTINVTKFSFSSNSSCFVSGETENGTFGLTGNLNGSVKGTFGMTITSGIPSGNVLTLTGTVNGTTISGKWQLTGAGNCNGSGNFTMTKM
jgi:hypothetical protein